MSTRFGTQPRRRHAATLGLVACAALLAACDPSASIGQSGAALDKPSGIIISPIFPVLHTAWNGGFDRFDAGALRNMPAVASNGTLWEMATVGTNQHLSVRESTDGVSWGAPVDLGGTFNGTPGIAFCRTALVVAAIDNSGAAWSFARGLGGSNAPGAWGGATSMGGVLLGGIGLIGNPTGYGMTAVGIGTNYQMWELTGIVGLWNDRWTQQTSGYTLAPVAPTGFTLGNGRLDILATSNAMVPLHEWETNGVVGGWESLGGVQLGLTQGTLVATSATTYTAYVIGTDRNTYQDEYDGTKWDGWAKIFGCSEGDGAYAVTPYPFSNGYADTTDLYLIGMDHQTIYHNRWSLFASATAGPQPYCCGSTGLDCCTPADKMPWVCNGDTTANYILCNAADNKCEQCGAAVGQTCCEVSNVSPAFPRCGGGLVCNIYNNECVGAGAPGGGADQVCRAGGICDAGYTCTGRTSNVAGFCKPNPTPTCQGAGGGCSSTAGCCSGLSCVGGACTANTSKTCGGNAVGASTGVYEIGIRDPNSSCAVGIRNYYANSAAEAKSCAAANYPGYDLLPNESPTEYDYSQLSEFGCTDAHVSVFSEDDLDACEQYQCENCSDSSESCEEIENGLSGDSRATGPLTKAAVAATVH